MIRVVADTNVYVSAIVFGGTCEAILALGRRILECALAAQADFLVSGDKAHLQPLREFRGIQIVSPRQFLDLLR